MSKRSPAGAKTFANSAPAHCRDSRSKWDWPQWSRRSFGIISSWVAAWPTCRNGPATTECLRPIGCRLSLRTESHFFQSFPSDLFHFGIVLLLVGHRKALEDVLARFLFAPH